MKCEKHLFEHIRGRPKHPGFEGEESQTEVKYITADQTYLIFSPTRHLPLLKTATKGEANNPSRKLCL